MCLYVVVKKPTRVKPTKIRPIAKPHTLWSKTSSLSLFHVARTSVACDVGEGCDSQTHG